MPGQLDWGDELQRHCELVIDRLLRGRVVPFLGAGVNLSERPLEMSWISSTEQYLPSGRELAAYLANEFHYPGSEKCGIEGCSQPTVELDLAKVSQYGATVLERGPLYDELRDVFTRKSSPTSVHRFLAEFPPSTTERVSDRHLLIISTNYDDLMEQALGEENFDLVFYDPNTKPRPMFWHKPPAPDELRPIDSPHDYDYVFFEHRPVVLKIHGTIDRTHPKRAAFVITEDDYIEYLAEEPLERLLPRPLIEKMQQRHHILFLGYSLRDWNFRVFLRRLNRSPQDTYGAWAVLLNADKVETKFWQKNGVDILSLTPEFGLKSYIIRLRNELASSRSRPASGGAEK
jgi:hypothetical protein